MGLLQDLLIQQLYILVILVDLCQSLSESADVLCDRRNQTNINNLPMYCQNGGTCIHNGCSCLGGFYGSVCQHSVLNAVIIIVVCILPPASWTMVFFYGCKERRRKRRLRQEQQQRIDRNVSTDDYSQTLFADDLPPSYYEISHTNPIALCGMDEAPYQSSSDGPPPDYDEVLKKAIECGAILPLQATGFLHLSETNETAQPSDEEVQESPGDEETHSSMDTAGERITPIEEGTAPVDEAGAPDAVVTVTNETLPHSTSEEDIEENDSPTPPSIIITDGHPAHSSREDLIASQLDESQQGEACSNAVPESISALVRKLSKKRAKRPSPTPDS